jgi:ParB/RepB/Spo0J family partition protein
MELVTMKVPVEKVLSRTDRKHGGEGDLETLARSIEEHGLIHPLAVKKAGEKQGQYRVIAGRRRFAAIMSLGYTTVEVTVYPDEADEAAIALAENVNREEMHPLDEAETFKRQLDGGKPVEEIAGYYNRSVSGIRRRVRLTGLIDGVKMAFRDGKINLSGAALIASLPEADQEKFHKKYGKKGANHWEIADFIRKAQRLTLEEIADDECGKCRNRTHNAGPGLFDDTEYRSIKDVCFDGECYAKKWTARIAGLILAEKQGNTEKTIFLDQSVPKFLPPKTETLTVAGEEYALLDTDKYDWSVTGKKSKSKTAWLVSCARGNTTIAVDRVTYKEYVRSTYQRSSPEPQELIKDYMIDRIPDIREEDREAAAKQVAQEYGGSPWDFRRALRERLRDAIIGKRLKEESRENLAACYLIAHRSGKDKRGKWCEIDPDYGNLFKAIFGPEGIAKPGDIPPDPLFQKVFQFLIASEIRITGMPGLDDDEEDWAETEASLFWKFAQVSRDEYITRYKEILSQAIRAAVGRPKALRGTRNSQAITIRPGNTQGGVT